MGNLFAASASSPGVYCGTQIDDFIDVNEALKCVSCAFRESGQIKAQHVPIDPRGCIRLMMTLLIKGFFYRSVVQLVLIEAMLW